MTARTKAIALALILLPSLAGAQTLDRCAPRDDMLAVLEKQYQEHVVATATVGENRPLEVTASESGSWTMFMTDPDTQMSCIIASGQKWSALKASWGMRI